MTTRELPDWRFMGCDPEPFGVRFERLIDRPQYATKSRTVAVPRCCPLAEPGDPARSCEGCPFYRVPALHHDCAVEEWARDAVRDERLAAWFRDVRDRVVAGG